MNDSIKELITLCRGLCVIDTDLPLSETAKMLINDIYLLADKIYTKSNDKHNDKDT